MTEVWAPSPSPIARFLLELDERGAEGAVEVGERTVLVRRGRVIEVRRAPGDPSLHEFLAHTGRIGDDVLAELRRSGLDPDRLPEGFSHLSQDALSDTMRALWLDRLVRGMARAEASGRGVSPLRPEAPSGGVLAEVALVPLVLDALERRAAEADAQQVGARTTHRLEWLEGPHTARARRWSGLDARETRIALLLASAPAAASRIAALVRAGIARVVSPETSAPAPARRLPSLPPAPTIDAAPRAPATSLPPPRPAPVQLSPGAAGAFASTDVLELALPELPPATRSLDDPLDPIEREIAVLEEAGAPAAERAAAWRAAAETWLARYGSVEERERALREAAAAVPDDPDTLLAAADACAACGHGELALAYGRAAVAAADRTARRDEVLVAFALLARRIGRPTVALSAARAVVQQGDADATRAADARAIAATILSAQGRAADAAEELLDAAVALREPDPERSAHLTGCAWTLAPGLERTRAAMIEALAARGRRLGVIALLADGARSASSPDERRRMRLAAAERAELDERPLLAADLLLHALDEEPELEVLYEPLDIDLEAAGALIERAVVLEELGVVAPPEARLSWTARAADARLGIPGDGSWELELRVRCLELDPLDARARDAVRQQAEAASDPMLLADALERAIRAAGWPTDGQRAAALEELATIAEQETSEPLRAAWARSVAAALGGEPIAKARARFESAIRPAMQRAAELDRMTREGSPEARRQATLALASILAQDPERRERAVSLLAAMIEEGWDDAAGDLLERIFALRGDVANRIAVLERRVEHEPRRVERVRRLLRIAGLEAGRGEHLAAARACLRVLEEVPGHREAIVRLRRAASRAGDDALLRDALEREARLDVAAPERARALTALAVRREAAGDREGALDAAIRALGADAEAAEAALVLARRLAADRGTAPLDVIARARALLGELPSLLAAAVRSAERPHEREDAVDRWARLAPHQSEPWTEALAVALTRGEAELVARAAEALARDPRTEPASVPTLVAALSEMATRGAVERAAAAAIAAADRFGEEGVPLRDLASTLAERAGSPTFLVAALERSVATADDAGAIATLRAIAEQHERFDDAAGEARALLRVLARAPRDAAAIERLAAIYASAGENERLMAVLALRVAEGADDAERFEGRLALAVASMRALGDAEGAEAFVRAAISGTPKVEDETALERTTRAAAVLAAIGRAERAVELLREQAQRAEGAWAGRLWERAAALATRHVGTARALDVADEGLRACPGHAPLLVGFEQLALEHRDVERAVRVYDALVEHAMGPSGRRALLYRRARWLERAGAERDALAAYLDAARHAASSGVILTAVERLARSTGDLDSLASGLVVLAENAQHPMIRLSMLRRAATVLEQEMGRPERAWDVLFPVWKETGLSELEEELGRLGATLAEVSPELGERAFGELFGELARRAEDAWMSDEKARLAMKAARLHALARGDLAAAERCAEQALAALRGEDDPEPARIAGVLAELASWLGRDPARREDARARAREAVEADPTSETAREVARGLGVEVGTGTGAGTGTATETATGDEAAEPGPRTAPYGRVAPVEPPRDAGHGSAAGPSAALDAAGNAGHGSAAGADEKALDAAGDAGHGSAAGADEKALDAAGDAGHGSAAGPSAALDAAGDAGHGSAAAGSSEEALGEPLRASLAPRMSRPPVAVPELDDEPAEDVRPSRMDLWLPTAPVMSAPSGGPAPIAMPVGEEDAAEISPDDLEALARALADGEGGRVEAVGLLRAALVTEPGRHSALELLAEIAEQAGMHADAYVARSALAAFDPRRSVPAPREVDARSLAASRTELLQNPAHETARRLLALVWESALPLFRQTAAQLGILGTDRVGTHTNSPVGRALAAALQALPEDEATVFAPRGLGSGVSPIRTHPPAVLVGAEAPSDEVALRFLLGRALELARPEHVLLATLPDEEGRTLIAALRAAFGPAEDAHVERDAAALAAQLWRTIPTRNQRDVRELLLEADATLDWDRLRASVLGGAARAGLVACGDLHAAIRALRALETEQGLLWPEAYSQAVAASGALADLLSFAFGDAFVAALQ